MVLRRRRWQFARDWSGVPLWPVPLTVLAALWLAAAVGAVGEGEPGVPPAPLPPAGKPTDRATGSRAGSPAATRPTRTAAAAADHVWFDPALRVSPGVAMGDGTLRSWVRYKPATLEPTSLGASFDAGALAGLSDRDPVEFVVRLPDDAAVPPFDHLAINWTPLGHEPVGVYDVPHFDVRFFTISEADRAKITATGHDLPVCARPLPAEHVPHGYVLASGAVPRVGAYWVDPAAPEFGGRAAFAAALRYGSYDGRLTCVEPMVARAFLESRPATFTQPLKHPPAYAARGYYPTSYRVSYDAQSEQYSVALEGLVRW